MRRLRRQYNLLSLALVSASLCSVVPAEAFPLISPNLSITTGVSCYQVGTTVVANIELSGAPSAIVGGQFFLAYDSTRLTFVSADPGPTVWTSQIFESVNTGAGTIDYAVGVPSGAAGAPSGTMAVLTFTTASEQCSAAGLVTFRTHTPPSKVIDENNIGYIAGTGLIVHDLLVVSIDSTLPVATTAPGAGNVSLACDDSAGLTAALAFLPSFNDNCSGSVGAILISDITTPDGDGGYVRVRSWNATDACGNSSNPYTQAITVVATCDDANACTQNDRCIAGQCQGTPINCDDGNPCTLDSCSGGNCQHVPIPSGSGDVNGDGHRNGRDIPSFVDAVLTTGGPTPGYCAADMNGDGHVDLADLPAFVAALLAG